MKQNRHSLRGFCLGLLTAALIAGTGLPAHALSALQQINVSMGGISMFVDGKLQVPTDVKGNVVEPLIYAGTTYLPVRAVVGMLTDKPVEWDAKTESIYIGQKPGPGQVVRLDTLKPYSGDGMRVGENAQFSILGEVQTPFNRSYQGSYVGKVVYKLDAGYTTLKGEFVIPYSNLNTRDAGKLCIYSVDKYGVEQLIDSYETINGDDPVSVEVNVRGCDFIMIRTESVKLDDWSGSSGVFYNATLTTATAG